MNITLSWDLFVIVFFVVILAYSLIIGRDNTLKVVVGTYISMIAADAGGALFAKYLSGSEAPNPIEEAQIYETMIKWRIEDGMTKAQAVEDVHDATGQPPTRIKNYLKFLDMPQGVQEAIIDGLPPKAALQIESAKREYGEDLSRVKSSKVDS